MESEVAPEANALEPAGRCTTADVAPPAPVPAPSPSLQREPERPSVVVRAWAKLRREPSLMFTCAYVLVSFIGLWANFWFYLVFDLPILEYMQASDYLVAGLRDPAYIGIALMMLAFVLVISWPDTWRRNHPQRVEAMRQHWWGRLLFPNSRWMRWRGIGVSPETGIVFGALWGMMWCATFYVQDKAGYIRDHGRGRPVQVTMAGDAAARPGQARLLGTSGAFVFLWWPEQRRAEAVPIESIARLGVQPPAAAKPGSESVAKPVAKPAPAAGAPVSTP